MAVRIEVMVKRFIGKMLDFIVSYYPGELVQALRRYYGPRRLNLSTVASPLIPARITGFHDLSYLFASHQANRGIIAQDFDEAAFLWGLIAEKRPRKILEIGRWLGGATVLLCSAASLVGGEVVSIDLKIKAPEFAKDLNIVDHLRRLGLSNYRLEVGSSFEFDPGSAMDFAFIDGDHSYAGVKRDLDNALRYLHSGASLVFHDSCATRPFATVHDGVAQLMTEMKINPERFRFKREVGSITHFEVV